MIAKKSQGSDHSYITKLPTFAARGEAIAKRLEAVKADPKYQALPEEHKAKVRADIYKKYVPASYNGFHLNVPDEKTWVSATGRDTSFKAPKTAAEKLSDTYKDARNKQFGQDVMVGMGKSVDNIALFGARVANKTFSAMHELDGHFSHNNDGVLSKAIYNAGDNTKKAIGNFIDSQHSRIQSEDFWIQTHPRDTTIGKLGSDAGEFIATLPLYEAVGALNILKEATVGAKLVRGAEGPVMPLTAKLARTKVGQFVAKRLINASEMYVSSLVQTGGDNKAAITQAVTGAGIESAGSVVVTKLKVASAPLIKKWSANVIAMGGKPFAQDLMQSAYTEMQPLAWWLKNGAEAGIPTYKNAITIGKDFHIFPETETTGKFVKDGQTYHYNGPQERQLIFDHLHKDNLQVRTKADPVMSKLHEAEKTTLDSIAISMKGKPLSELTDAEHTDVIVRRHELIEEAAEEAPYHLPDLLKDEVEHTIESARKQMPELNKFMAQDEQMFGAKFADVQAANDKQAVAKETGISNANGATKKLRKGAKELAPKSSASLNASEYATHKADTIAYLRAPRNRAKVAEAVSDRSRAGLNKFIDVLKEADRSRISFENPTHRMLYHYGNRKGLPTGMSGSLLYRIRQLEGYEHSSAKDIQKEADWLHVHLLNLAHSGHLGPEKNVFASSKFDGPLSWTKWQRQLGKEADVAQLDSARKALQQHPTALRAFNSVVGRMQKLSAKYTTPAEYLEYRNALSEHASKARVSNVIVGPIQ